VKRALFRNSNRKKSSNYSMYSNGYKLINGAIKLNIRRRIECHKQNANRLSIEHFSNDFSRLIITDQEINKNNPSYPVIYCPPRVGLRNDEVHVFLNVYTYRNGVHKLYRKKNATCRAMCKNSGQVFFAAFTSKYNA